MNFLKSKFFQREAYKKKISFYKKSRGTETSNYPVEKKSNEISLVVASESELDKT